MTKLGFYLFKRLIFKVENSNKPRISMSVFNQFKSIFWNSTISIEPNLINLSFVIDSFEKRNSIFMNKKLEIQSN